MKIRLNHRKCRGAAFAALALGFLSLLTGCASQDENPTGKGAARLILQVTGIADAVDSSSTRVLPAPETVNRVQADGTVLSFTLAPKARSITKAGPQPMTGGYTYKYVVLDHTSGKIVGAVDGVAGTASPTIGVPDNGLAYDIVAYSYNSNSTTLPSPGAVNSVATTIGMAPNVDLLCFTEQLAANALSPSPATNTRNITFSHKYSQVTVVVNAPDAISAASFTLGASYPADLTLSNGGVAKPAGAANTPATVTGFTGLGTQVATSTPVALFTNGEAPLTLTVGSLTTAGLPGSHAGAHVAFNRGLLPGVSYTLTVNAHKASTGDFILTQNQRYFVASVYDDHYFPYTLPTLPAATGSSNPSGGTTDPLLNVQGKITTGGVQVKIPVTSGSGHLYPYSTTVAVPGSLIQGGNGGNPVTLKFSWGDQDVTAGTPATATIQAVGSDLNAIQLDINAGIGSDFLGVLLAQFTYPYNSAGTTTTYSVRDISGIPDRMFGLADNSGNIEHNFLYLPVQAEDGKVWLNNNLGADYANINNPNFNLAQQAKTFDDYHAYGSLFQWGRAADGHELINWTSSTGSNNGTGVNDGTYDVLATTDTPTGSNYKYFVVAPTLPFDWRSGQNNSLWQGASGINNPCPIGFHVPTDDGTTASEFGKLVSASAANITNIATAWSSKLKFSISGYRDSYIGALYNAGSNGDYWSSSVSGTYAYFRIFSSEGTSTNYYGRGGGLAVRCLKN